MNTICGADCEQCMYVKRCPGCEATCGKPFGGTCVAAEYIRVGGKAAYDQFKEMLRGEINSMLRSLGIPENTALYELVGDYVNLKYRLPSGEAVPFLDSKKIYLGCQMEIEGMDRCFGAVADTTFILICSYGANGADPELILYQKR